ncbi:hypothetical protein CACET_c15410 [Clostridium aceticum]|uniref:Uncharacterized protein n=2 Tax=Clostridium TaxID=1485 RepID=A0A0D8ID59_9CLOT|nr:BC1881 family protein [Clostridium aceticum]AKL94990.1 hypothetical protein CACET_c15410 [Clostridium aceticum]KJF27897.1 hypothetical protein TZ02_04775 [Clostridium aceticum]
MFGKKLSDYSIEELVKEIVCRKHTSILKADKHQVFQVKNNQKRIREKGPAVVLVIREEA